MVSREKKKKKRTRRLRTAVYAGRSIRCAWQLHVRCKSSSASSRNGNHLLCRIKKRSLDSDCILPVLYDKVSECMPAVVYRSEDSRYNTDAELPRGLLSAVHRTIILANPALEGIETKSEYNHRLLNRNAANDGVSRLIDQAYRSLRSLSKPVLIQARYYQPYPSAVILITNCILYDQDCAEFSPSADSDHTK